MNREQQIRQDHPDWTDEQVAAEVARLHAADPPATPPPDADRDAAFARMRREKEEAEKRAKDAEDKLAAEERKKAEEQGEWQKLAEQEKARADKLDADRVAADERSNAERIATGLKFKDPGYALYLLQQQSVDLADAAKVKETLDGIIKDRAELIDGAAPPPSGGPAGTTTDDTSKVTVEQLRTMTPQQVAALDPKVVEAALNAAK